MDNSSRRGSRPVWRAAPFLTVLLLLQILVVAGCRADPSEAERIERSRLAALYEQHLREREVEWVRTVGRGMGTVLALRVSPEAHDTARTALALIMDDVLVPEERDGIKAITVLLASDRTGTGPPGPYVATWVENGRVERALRGLPPEAVTAEFRMEELQFDVAGSIDNRRITLRLYYTTEGLEALLAERRRQQDLPPAR